MTLPYYGGARGQILQIKRNPDGSVISEIVTQHPELPMNEVVRRDMSSFQQNLIDIQQAASQLVTLQQNIKLSGKLTETDHRLYAENLQKLGVSAQNLAHIQLAGGQDDFRLLFEGPLFGNADEKAHEESGSDVVRSDQDHKDEESVGEESGTTTTTVKPTTDDSVQVSVPDKEASVAEAKPVGLAIAGEGGVASSKPVATAVVGPGGLAVARPIATAIAGVSPNDVAALGIPLSNRFKTSYFRDVPDVSHVAINIPTPTTNRKYGLAHGTGRDRIGLLIGPDFQKIQSPEEPIAAEEPNQQTDIKADDNQSITEQSLHTRLTPENELLPPIPQHNRPQLAAEHIAHHPPVQYPFIPPVSPYRFNWDSEPVDHSPHYEPIPFFDKRAYSFPQFYPIQQNMLPLHPYHFQNHYH